MTSLTVVILGCMMLAVLSRAGYGWALAVGGATPVGAAFIAGPNALPTFYAAAAGAAAILAARVIDRSRRGDAFSPLFPGGLILLAFVGWSYLVTLIAPILFVNKATFTGPNIGSVSFISGAPDTSNIAQMLYLALGVLVVFFLAGEPKTGPDLLGLLLGLTTLLSFWRYSHQNFGLPFPEGFFDNNSTYAFIETLPGGAPRFRGIFSEPAGLAGSALVTMAYFISAAYNSTGQRRFVAIAVSSMAAIMALKSTSTTFTVVAAILVALVILRIVYLYVLHLGAIQPLAIVVAVIAASVAIWLLPSVIASLISTVNEKVNTQSFQYRTGTDQRAYDLIFETFGIGVGLGSNRGSSFVAAMLSTVGIPGLALFTATFVRVAFKVRRLESYRPVIWAVVALMITKILSAPDLADSSGVLWVSLGVLARGAVFAPTPFDALSSTSVWPTRSLRHGSK